MKKKIKDFENYEIYDNGDVVNTSTGKRLFGSLRLNGYLEYRLSKNNIKYGFYAHRLVAEAFIPNPENLKVVNHIDGNKLNNHVSNLEWVDYSTNTEHAYQIGWIAKRRPGEFYENDLEDEEWKPVPCFPNYLVSNYGRVRNITTNRLLRSSQACGYEKVRLSHEGQVKDIMIHHLVFEVFTEEIREPIHHKIDHIDGNKLNNHINNLRQISNRENALAALYETKTNQTAKAVNQYDLEGNYIATFRSVREAAVALHLDNSTISKVCRGKNKSHGGFLFRFSEDQF